MGTGVTKLLWPSKTIQYSWFKRLSGLNIKLFSHFISFRNRGGDCPLRVHPWCRTLVWFLLSMREVTFVKSFIPHSHRSWGKEDSNPRRHKPKDLESFPFDHSGIPSWFLVKRLTERFAFANHMYHSYPEQMQTASSGGIPSSKEKTNNDIKTCRMITINFKNEVNLSFSCVGSLAVRICRCQRWYPGSIPGPRIFIFLKFWQITL